MRTNRYSDIGLILPCLAQDARYKIRERNGSSPVLGIAVSADISRSCSEKDAQMFVKIRIWLCIYHCHLQLKTRAAQYRPRTTKPRGTTGNVVAPNSKNCKCGSAKLARPAKSSRSNPTGRLNDATLTMNSWRCDFHTSLSGRKPHWRFTPFHNTFLREAADSSMASRLVCHIDV